MTGFMYVEERDALKPAKNPLIYILGHHFKSKAQLGKKKKKNRSLNLLWAPIMSINYSLSFFFSFFLEMELNTRMCTVRE